MSTMIAEKFHTGRPAVYTGHMPGFFIVIDGPDGSGTTTHARLLADSLRSEARKVALTSEPTDGPVAHRIRDFLEGKSNEVIDAEQLQILFCDDRAEHVRGTIQPALDNGKIVICDRYTFSTIAYGMASGADIQQLQEINAAFPTPNVTIFTLPPLDVCLERLSERSSKDLFEQRLMQEKVHAAYTLLAQEDPTIHVVDTSDEPARSAARILSFVRQQLS
ncbi:MAG: dTMP kinase [Candidatus Peregrinibacteria bacterium Greene0416_19]|nr:MAG: dTMP kinase [Candidatus Peregrinibacteria bacterium Greene0416_19]